MCLTRLENFEVKETEGWKVFRKNQSKLQSLFNWAITYLFKCNEWIIDTAENQIFFHIGDSNSPTGTTIMNYDTGFHIWLSKKDVNKVSDWIGRETSYPIIRKVKFKNIMARGYQSFPTVSYPEEKVIVAKEIFIIDTIWDKINDSIRLMKFELRELWKGFFH